MHTFHMRDQTSGITCPLVDTEPHYKLAFRADLHIVGWFGPGLIGGAIGAVIGLLFSPLVLPR